MKPLLLGTCLLATPALSDPQLLFASGFEGIETGPMADGYLPLLGRDTATGFSWPIRILGASGSALHFIEDDNRQAVDSRIVDVIGHTGRHSRALYSEENYAHDATQAPYEILDIRDGRADLYIRYWIKIDSQSFDQPDSWRTFFEWKTKGYARGTGFRLISFIYTDKGGDPYWHWQGDANPEQPLWEIDNHDIPVPQDEWFLTEFYWHWSRGKDGRALWRINGEVVGDHYGPTTRHNRPIDFIMLTQIYGDANPKYQWIDDIEIWDGLPD
jgi:hypothetical protein